MWRSCRPSQPDDISLGRGWITLALCAAALFCTILGDTTAPLLAGARVLSALFGLAVAGVALWTIIEVNRHPFGRAISTVGIGLYLLIAAGVAIALLPGLVRLTARYRPSGPPPPQPPTSYPGDSR